MTFLRRVSLSSVLWLAGLKQLLGPRQAPALAWLSGGIVTSMVMPRHEVDCMRLVARVLALQKSDVAHAVYTRIRSVFCSGVLCAA